MFRTQPFHLPRVVRVIRVVSRRPILLGVALALAAINLAVPAHAPAATDPVAPAELDAWFDGVVRDAGIPGASLAVVEDGRIVHEHGLASRTTTAGPSPRTRRSSSGRSRSRSPRSRSASWRSAGRSTSTHRCGGTCPTSPWRTRWPSARSPSASSSTRRADCPGVGRHRALSAAPSSLDGPGPGPRHRPPRRPTPGAAFSTPTRTTSCWAD